MKTHIQLLVLVTLLFIPLPMYSQESGIFHYVDEHAIDLTDRQKELLRIIESWPQTKNVYLIRLDEARFDAAKRSLQINLPERVIEAEKREPGRQAEYRTTWSGRMVGTLSGTILLSVDNDDLTGHIQTGGQLFSISPLTGGIQALIEIHPDRFDAEAPPVNAPDNLEEDREYHKQRGVSGNGPAQISSADPLIDVLVAYTPAAKAGAGNIRALIYQAGDLLNLSFGNSDVSASIHIVAMVEVDYQEIGGNMLTDLSRLQGTSDGYMDEVHALRNDFKADLVVLIVGVADACGIAFTPKSFQQTSATGFSVTRYDCIAGHTFSHEIGHNLGAHHDVDNIPNNDPTASPYEHGHGYRFTHSSVEYRTIMAYTPGFRVNYWSNPGINYLGGGPAMGTAQYEDNARVWDDRAATVADFRSSPAPKTVEFSNGYTLAIDNPVTFGNGTTVLLGGDLVINSGSELTLGSNVSIQFTDPSILIVNGTVRVGGGVDIRDAIISVGSTGEVAFTGPAALTFIEIPAFPPFSYVPVFSSSGRLTFTNTGTVSMSLSPNSIWPDWYGLQLSGSGTNGSVVKNVDITDSHVGVSLSSLSGVVLENITITAPTVSGVTTSAANVSLINVTVDSPADYGFDLAGGYPELVNAVVTGSPEWGVYAHSGASTDVAEGSTAGTQTGVHITGAGRTASGTMMMVK